MISECVVIRRLCGRSEVSPRMLPGIARRRRGTDNRSMPNRTTSNRTTAQNEWQRRIARAEELGAQYSFASEIMRFYVAVAHFQEKFYGELGRSLERSRVETGKVKAAPFAPPLLPQLTVPFGRF